MTSISSNVSRASPRMKSAMKLRSKRPRTWAKPWTAMVRLKRTEDKIYEIFECFRPPANLRASYWVRGAHGEFSRARGRRAGSLFTREIHELADVGILKFESRKDDRPFHPYVELELTKYTKDQEGRIILTPDLVSPREIDFWCDHLIVQIELARVKAKRHVTAAKRSLDTASHHKG
jgi:hypothetical protein